MRSFKETSFPRKRESSFQSFFKRLFTAWIPTFAGMTFVTLCAIHCSSATVFGAQTGQSGAAYQSYLKALLLESQGNFAAANSEIEKALTVAPESAFLHRTAAELALRLGQVNRASDEIERAIELDPKDVRALIVAGQIQWALGDSEKAEARLRRALAINPDESEALISLAGTITPKNPKEAIKLYKDFLVRHPNEAEIQERLAQLYQATNDFSNAKKTWEEVLENNPSSVRAHLALAQLAEINFDTATAISHYEGVLVQDPTNLPLLLRVGELRYRNNDMAKASEAFTKAQTVSPSSPAANFWLALLAENRGDWPEAIRLLKNVPEGTRETGVMLRLSYYYSQNGQYKEAVNVLKRLSDSDPSNIDFLNYLAIAYEQDKQLSNAEVTLKKIIALDPNDPEAHFHLGTLYDRTNRFSKAEEELKTAIRLKPDFHMALNYLGYSYGDRNVHLDEAEKLVNDAIAFDPHNPAYLDSMGWIYFRQGKLDKAKDFLHEASSQVNDSVIWDHFGDLQMASGQPVDAVMSWDEALRLNPKEKAIQAKMEKAMARISKADKVDLFVRRSLANYGDLESIQGLSEITVCQSKPCFRSKAQFGYERGADIKLEIPGPLSGPVLLLTKKHGQAAKYGALHPQFQTVEKDVVRAFDRLESLLSAEVFKQYDLKELEQNSVLKGNELSASAKNFRITFNAKTGVVKTLEWNDDDGQETLSIGAGTTPQSASLAKTMEWKRAATNFLIRIEFLNPVVATSTASDETASSRP